jgi:hypothetical protein
MAQAKQTDDESSNFPRGWTAEKWAEELKSQYGLEEKPDVNSVKNYFNANGALVVLAPEGQYLAHALEKEDAKPNKGYIVFSLEYVRRLCNGRNWNTAEVLETSRYRLPIL